MPLLKKHYAVEVDATPQRVYHMIIGDKTYPQWVSAFSEGFFEGNWSKGSKMRFLGVDKDGNISGLVSTIEENIPNEYISIKHIGEVKDATEFFDTEAVKAWAPSFENYRITKLNSHTKWEVEMDVLDSYESYFDGHWPIALKGFKQIVEAANLTVGSTIEASVDKVWQCWTEPDHITKWNFASDDWHCPTASTDLKVGGKYCSTMAAKDGSFSFDLNMLIDEVEINKLLKFILEDGRRVKVEFEKISDNKTKITETFDIEHENSPELQHAGWQAIVDNFKKHVESH